MLFEHCFCCSDHFLLRRLKIKGKVPIFDLSKDTNISDLLFDGTCPPGKSLRKHQTISDLYLLPEQYGDGYVEFLRFNDSMTVFIFNCHWLKARSFKLKSDGRIRFNFSLDFGLKTELEEQDTADKSGPILRIVNSPTGDEIFEKIQADAQTTWVTIVITKRKLIDLFDDTRVLEHPNLVKLLNGNEDELYFEQYYLDHNVNLVLSHLLSMNTHDRIHLSYVEAKIKELTCVAMERVLREESKNILPVKLNSRDERAIRVVKEIVSKNLASLPSVREICLMVGMNRNKLHYGFKHYFNVSFSQFVKEERITRAYNLLMESDRSVIDIALKVGFQHQSSLSTAFKKKYGVSPIQLRKNKQAVPSNS
ncbi:MAG: AraC family transcriptional regulator [Kangiellaceae bacterium]|nr:AraC family transcriptional regulator [Kangiellaceae bacterium]